MCSLGGEFKARFPPPSGPGCRLCRWRKTRDTGDVAAKPSEGSAGVALFSSQGGRSSATSASRAWSRSLARWGHLTAEPPRLFVVDLLTGMNTGSLTSRKRGLTSGGSSPLPPRPHLPPPPGLSSLPHLTPWPHPPPLLTPLASPPGPWAKPTPKPSSCVLP